MKSKITDKIRYYTGQYDRAVDRWIDTGKVNERVQVIRLRENLKVYKQLLEMINQEK